MMFKSLAATLLLASSALAMEFTNPISGSDWSFSESQTITWTAPSGQDPAKVSLLVANVDPSYLPYYGTPLALDIPASQGSFSMAGVSLPVAENYMILMVDPKNSSHIYIQGGKFAVHDSNTPLGNKVGSGFSVASTTTAPARMARHKRGV